MPYINYYIFILSFSLLLHYFCFFFLMIRHPPRSTLFPYPPLFRSAGATSVAVAEAFQDAGKPVAPMTAEDQQDFLALWQKNKLTAIAPTYPVYQWRTAVIAARSEEHTSELQSRLQLVCRLPL